MPEPITLDPVQAHVMAGQLLGVDMARIDPLVALLFAQGALQSVASIRFPVVAQVPPDRLRAVEAAKEALAAIERTMTAGIVTAPGLRIVKPG